MNVRALCGLIAALKRVPEGNGTLLDSTTILVTSEHCGEHHAVQIPHFALLAGGGGIKSDGTRHYKTGRYIKLPYTKNGRAFSGLRSAADLCLTLAHGAGVTRAKDNDGVVRDLDSFGHPMFSKGPVI